MMVQASLPCCKNSDCGSVVCAVYCCGMIERNWPGHMDYSSSFDRLLAVDR